MSTSEVTYAWHNGLGWGGPGGLLYSQPLEPSRKTTENRLTPSLAKHVDEQPNHYDNPTMVNHNI